MTSKSNNTQLKNFKTKCAKTHKKLIKRILKRGDQFLGCTEWYTPLYIKMINKINTINKNMQFYKYENIEKEIKKIEYIDFKQRDIVLSEIKKYLVDDKLTYEEFKNVINKLREEFKISKIDEKYLNQLLIAIKQIY